MIIVLKPHTPADQIEQVIAEVARLGYTPHAIRGAVQTVVAAIGDETTHPALEALSALPQVQKVMALQKRYKLVSRESHPALTVIDVAGVPVGGPRFTV